MTDYYTDSKGNTVDITTIHPAALPNKIAKLERMDPDSDQLPAMRELAAKQKADWERDHPPEGVSQR